VIDFIRYAAFGAVVVVAAVLTLDTVVSIMLTWVAGIVDPKAAAQISVWKLLASTLATVAIDLTVALVAPLIR